MLVKHQLSEAELVRGKNGVSLFSDWHKPEEPEDCSWRDVAKACKTKGGY